MTSDQEAAHAALRRFYDAIEVLISGGGVQAMTDAWHHTDYVTSLHPSGGWSTGWEELLATWRVFAGFGREDRGGSSIDDVTVGVHGDLALATCVFTAAPAWGGERIPCSNVLQRIDGDWRVIHHHANRSVAMEKALEKIARG